MSYAVFDIEADGFLEDVTKAHCICIEDSNGQAFGSGPGHVEQELENLDRYDTIVGHNIMGYDIPVLKKLYGWTPKAKVFDTLLASRLIYTDDKYSKKHSLEAWGLRLGLPKGDSPEDFSTFTPKMMEYCARDVELNKLLYEKILGENYSQQALDLEHDFARIIRRQEEYGFGFDVGKASALYVSLLRRREEISGQLIADFGGWYKPEGVFTPKRSDKTKGYGKGSVFTRIKWVQFNPNSRDHIAYILKRKFGWKPRKMTEGGKPKIDESVLASLNIQEAKPLQEFLLLAKRISMLAEGNNAWLKLEKDGRIYGKVITNGAVTGRCTHSRPNVAQVPAVRSPYGPECRELFCVRDANKWLVGIDASGLELRALAGYLSRYDDGEYIRIVTEGKKEEGTGIHQLNALALGTDPEIAKTWIYAFIYGAQDTKLGNIMGKGKPAGAESRARMVSQYPALGRLVGDVHKSIDKRGYLMGLDGRKLFIRSKHSAINTLLQSAGALIMKKGLVIFDHLLREQRKYIPGKDYEFVANVHDEWQVECLEYASKALGQTGVDALQYAGQEFNFPCPITGEYKIGKNWEETH